MEGDGYPMVASHDPRMVAIAGELARRSGREPASFEYQMLYGIRPEEQLPARGARAARCGSTCPTVSSGTATSCDGWPSGPANLGFFARSLVSQK